MAAAATGEKQPVGLLLQALVQNAQQQKGLMLNLRTRKIEQRMDQKKNALRSEENAGYEGHGVAAASAGGHVSEREASSATSMSPKAAKRHSLPERTRAVVVEMSGGLRRVSAVRQRDEAEKTISALARGSDPRADDQHGGASRGGDAFGPTREPCPSRRLGSEADPRLKVSPDPSDVARLKKKKKKKKKRIKACQEEAIGTVAEGVFAPRLACPKASARNALFEGVLQRPALAAPADTSYTTVDVAPEPLLHEARSDEKKRKQIARDERKRKRRGHAFEAGGGEPAVEAAIIKKRKKSKATVEGTAPPEAGSKRSCGEVREARLEVPLEAVPKASLSEPARPAFLQAMPKATMSEPMQPATWTQERSALPTPSAQHVDPFWGRAPIAGAAPRNHHAYRASPFETRQHPLASPFDVQPVASPFDARFGEPLANVGGDPVAAAEANASKPGTPLEQQQPRPVQKDAGTSATSGSSSDSSSTGRSRRGRGKRRRRARSRSRWRRRARSIVPPDGWMIWPPPTVRGISSGFPTQYVPPSGCGGWAPGAGVAAVDNLSAPVQPCAHAPSASADVVRHEQVLQPRPPQPPVPPAPPQQQAFEQRSQSQHYSEEQPMAAAATQQLPSAQVAVHPLGDQPCAKSQGPAASPDDESSTDSSTTSRSPAAPGDPWQTGSLDDGGAAASKTFDDDEPSDPDELSDAALGAHLASFASAAAELPPLVAAWPGPARTHWVKPLLWELDPGQRAPLPKSFERETAASPSPEDSEIEDDVDDQRLQEPGEPDNVAAFVGAELFALPLWGRTMDWVEVPLLLDLDEAVMRLPSKRKSTEVRRRARARSAAPPAAADVEPLPDPQPPSAKSTGEAVADALNVARSTSTAEPRKNVRFVAWCPPARLELPAGTARELGRYVGTEYKARQSRRAQRLTAAPLPQPQQSFPGGTLAATLDMGPPGRTVVEARLGRNDEAPASFGSLRAMVQHLQASVDPLSAGGASSKASAGPPHTMQVAAPMVESQIAPLRSALPLPGGPCKHGIDAAPLGSSWPPAGEAPPPLPQATVSYTEGLASTIDALELDIVPPNMAVQSLWDRLSAADRQRFSTEFPQFMHYVNTAQHSRAFTGKAGPQRLVHPQAKALPSPALTQAPRSQR